MLLQLNADEEVGSHSSRALTGKNAAQSDCVLVLEPGTGLTGKLKTARKGVGDYRVTVRGKAAHSGVDFAAGASAVLELARFWEEHPPGDRIEKQWNEMVNNDSQNSPFPRRKRIQDLPDALVNQKER